MMQNSTEEVLETEAPQAGGETPGVVERNMKDSRSRMMILVMLAAVVVVVIGTLFVLQMARHRRGPDSQSAVVGAPTQDAPQLTDKAGGLSPLVEQSVKAGDAADAANAAANGTSSAITPTESPLPKAEEHELEGIDASKAGASVHFKPLEAIPPTQYGQTQATETHPVYPVLKPVDVPPTPAYVPSNPEPQTQGSSSANSMSTGPDEVANQKLGAMQALMQRMGTRPAATSVSVGAEKVNGVAAAQVASTAGGTATPTSSSGNSRNATSAQDSEELLPQTSVLYGQMLIEANSDAPGPVFAEVVGGPFRGARLTGAFKTATEALTLQFSAITLASGETIQCDAIAVNPDTRGSIAMATDVNHHYVERFGGVFVSSLLKGFGQAAAQSGASLSVLPSGAAVSATPVLTTAQQVKIALGDVGSDMGDYAKQQLTNIKPTIVLAANTPIGIIFQKPLVRKIGSAIPQATLPEAPAIPLAAQVSGK